MASWIARVGAALGLDKDARSLDAALDEDSARAARGITPIRDVTDRSHALVFGTLLGMTYPPEEGTQRVPHSTTALALWSCAGLAARPSPGSASASASKLRALSGVRGIAS